MATYVVCMSNAYFLGGKEMVASKLLCFWREPPHLSVSFDAGTYAKGKLLSFFLGSPTSVQKFYFGKENLPGCLLSCTHR